MSDYPIRVEISEKAIKEHERSRLLHQTGRDYTDVKLRQWLDGLPRVPEPEQRACVGCARWRRRERPEGTDYCDCQDDFTVDTSPWASRWDPNTHACPAWQPRRDKAEELAVDVQELAKSAAKGLFCRYAKNMKKAIDDPVTSMLGAVSLGDIEEEIARVLREAGIGGDDD